jgi:hypothetical protein
MPLSRQPKPSAFSVQALSREFSILSANLQVLAGEVFGGSLT